MSADMLVRRGYFEDDVSQPSGDHSLRGLSKVLYDAVGQLSSGLSEEAISTLCDDAKSLELNPLTLRFRNTGQYSRSALLPGIHTGLALTAFQLCVGIEAEFQHHVAVRRRPILILVFCFDVTCYLFRMAAKYAKTGVAFHTLVKGMLPQFCNTLFLYSFLWLLNRRSRCKGHAAAQQVSSLNKCELSVAIHSA